MMSRKSSSQQVRFVVLSAVIAALYAVLTYVTAAMNLAYGPVQFRLSEALTILPVFTPAAVPGLALGCFLSNLSSPFGVIDWVFGTSASLLAALGTLALSKLRYKGVALLAPLPPVVVNALLVGLELSFFSSAGAFSFSNFTPEAFAAGALSVGAGQLAVCYGLGLPLMIVIQKLGIFDRLSLKA